MICVYPADCIDFSTNGNGTLAPLSAEVTETLNGEYELTLVHAGSASIIILRNGNLRAAAPRCMTMRPIAATGKSPQRELVRGRPFTKRSL